MKKYYITFISLCSSLFGLTHTAHAICPICTIAVGAGVGLTRAYGIDDTVSGLWIGALIVASVVWTIRWFNSKNWHFAYRDLITWATYYLLIVVPLAYTDIIGHPQNVLWGIDKLLVGIVVGSAVFYAGEYAYPILKERNGGHAHFPFEKVVLPVAPLIALSVIFYFITT